MAAPLLLCFGLLLAGLSLPTCSGSHDNYHWSYTGETGPATWATHFETCGGSNQSPVNIVPSAAQCDLSLSGLTLEKFDKVDDNIEWTLENNGHSAQVTYNLNNNLTVLGGGLSPLDMYEVAQFHFHWGSDDTQGSEHTLDGQRFPMEMHIVTFNKKYGDMGTAATKDDGLAVLGSFFKVQSDNNTNYDNLIAALARIPTPGNTTNVVPTKLRSLMPEKVDKFFRYSGSLTTPPCSEVVTWTVFKEPVPISSAQLSEFRKLKTKEGEPLVDNFRPIQALNGRQMWRSC